MSQRCVSSLTIERLCHYREAMSLRCVSNVIIERLCHRGVSVISDFIWPCLAPYMGVIPNPKMAFIFPISCIVTLIFLIFMKYFPKCSGKGSFPKSLIKSLVMSL